MASVRELRARTGAEPAYVLFIEGLEYAFTDEPELEGTAWIGTEHGPRTVLGGLKPGITMTERVEIRNSGLLETGEATFELIDQDHTTLVNLFGTQRDTSTLYQLGERLSPRVKRVDRDYAAWGGGPDIDLRNKFVGLERIGPDGERGWFWILPVHKRKWLRRDHPVTEYSDTDQDNNLPPVFVSEEPIQFAGRGVALFEVYKDDDGTWKSWEECYEGGGLWFYGKLLDEGELSSVRTWSLQAAGFSAWLRKPLNSGKPDRGYAIQGTVSLTPGQRGIAVYFGTFGESGGALDGDTHDGMMFETDFAATDNTPAELLAHVRDQVDKALNGGTGHTSGADGPYADVPNDQVASKRWASFQDDSVLIRVEKADTASSRRLGQMFVCMHEIAWRALGWDPQFQRQLPQEDQRRVQFTPVPGQSFTPLTGLGGKQQLGSDGYWIAEFTTATLGGGRIDNNGGDRKYSAAYQGGAYSLRASGRQQIKISIGKGPFVEGINARRPADGAEIDATQTDGGVDPAWDLERRAHHEAGHVVAGWVGLGDFVEWASIVPTDGSTGHTFARFEIDWPGVILFAVGGPVFEATFRGPSRCGSPSDEALVRRACEAQGLDPDRAVADANRLLIDIGGDEPAVRDAHAMVVEALLNMRELDRVYLAAILGSHADGLAAVREKYAGRLAQIGRGG